MFLCSNKLFACSHVLLRTEPGVFSSSHLVSPGLSILITNPVLDYYPTSEWKVPLINFRLSLPLSVPGLFRWNSRLVYTSGSHSVRSTSLLSIGSSPLFFFYFFLSHLHSPLPSPHPFFRLPLSASRYPVPSFLSTLQTSYISMGSVRVTHTFSIRALIFGRWLQCTSWPPDRYLYWHFFAPLCPLPN